MAGSSRDKDTAKSKSAGVVRRAAPQQGIVVQTKRGGERHLNISGTTFRIPERYNHLEVVGKGSYGVVCSAVDSYRKNPVAIKKISPMAAQSIDAKHVLREVRIMRYLGAHENIVTLEDVFCNEVTDELYIVMELLASDLHRIIQSPQKLSMQHKRVFMMQILRGVEFLHDNEIMHRDLKPGNLLVTKNCELRISDFGLARARPKVSQTCGQQQSYPNGDSMTEHVITRWYRPPELMLSPNGHYNFSVDVWSVGCIFGELLGRRPLFPGSSFVEQLSLIFDVIGSPTPAEVEHIRGIQAREFLLQVEGRSRVEFTDLLPGTDADAAGLLDRLLRFSPEKRCTPAEGLRHPFFEEVRAYDTLHIDLPKDLDFEFERKDVPHSTLKNLIAKEIDYFQSGGNLHEHADRAHPVSPQAPSVRTGTATVAAAAEATRRPAFSSSDEDGSVSRNSSDSGDSRAEGEQGLLRSSSFSTCENDDDDTACGSKGIESTSNDDQDGVPGVTESDDSSEYGGGCSDADQPAAGVDTSAGDLHEEASPKQQLVVFETKVTGERGKHERQVDGIHNGEVPQQSYGAEDEDIGEQLTQQSGSKDVSGRSGVHNKWACSPRATSPAWCSHDHTSTDGNAVLPLDNRESSRPKSQQKWRSPASSAQIVDELKGHDSLGTVGTTVRKSSFRGNPFTGEPPYGENSTFQATELSEPMSRRKSIAGFVSGGNRWEDTGGVTRAGEVENGSGRWWSGALWPSIMTVPLQISSATGGYDRDRSGMAKETKGERGYDLFVSGEFDGATKDIFCVSDDGSRSPDVFLSHSSKILRREREARAWQVVHDAVAQRQAEATVDTAGLAASGPRSGPRTATAPRSILRNDRDETGETVAPVSANFRLPSSSRNLRSAPANIWSRSLSYAVIPNTNGNMDRTATPRKKVASITFATAAAVNECGEHDNRSTILSEEATITVSHTKLMEEKQRESGRARIGTEEVALWRRGSVGVSYEHTSMGHVQKYIPSVNTDVNKTTTHSRPASDGCGSTSATTTGPMRAPIASVYLRQLSEASSHGSPPPVPPPLRQRWKHEKCRSTGSLAVLKGATSDTNNHRGVALKAEHENIPQPAVGPGSEANGVFESQCIDRTVEEEAIMSSGCSEPIALRSGSRTVRQVVQGELSTCLLPKDGRQSTQSAVTVAVMATASSPTSATIEVTTGDRPYSATAESDSCSRIDDVSKSFRNSEHGISREGLTRVFDCHTSRLSKRKAARVGTTRSTESTPAVISISKAQTMPQTMPYMRGRPGKPSPIMSGGGYFTSGRKLASTECLVVKTVDNGIQRTLPSYLATMKTWHSLASSSRFHFREDRSIVGRATGKSASLSRRATTVPGEVGLVGVAAGRGGNRPDQQGGGRSVDDGDDLSTASVEKNLRSLQQLWMHRSTSERNTTFGVATTSSSSRSVASTAASSRTEQSLVENEMMANTNKVESFAHQLTQKGAVFKERKSRRVHAPPPPYPLSSRNVQLRQLFNMGSLSECSSVSPLVSLSSQKTSKSVVPKIPTRSSSNNMTSCTSGTSCGGTSVTAFALSGSCRSIGTMPSHPVVRSRVSPVGLHHSVIPSKVASLIPSFPEAARWRRMNLRAARRSQINHVEMNSKARTLGE